MKCSDVEKYLQTYVDGEFDKDEESEIEQHFKFCPACQKRVAFETWFKKGFKNSVQNPATPRRLAAEIHYQLKREKRRQTPIWIKLSPAAAVFLVFLATYLSPRIDVHTPIVEATVDKHIKDLPNDIKSDDDQLLKQYFQEKIRFPVHIPVFSSHHMRLIGGRVSSVQNRSAAYISYQGNGKRYSVMARPLGGEEDPSILSGGIERTVDNRKFNIVKRDGYNVILWTENQMIYSLVADEDENELIKIASSVRYDQPHTTPFGGSGKVMMSVSGGF